MNGITTFLSYTSNGHISNTIVSATLPSAPPNLSPLQRWTTKNDSFNTMLSTHTPARISVGKRKNHFPSIGGSWALTLQNPRFRSTSVQEIQSATTQRGEKISERPSASVHGSFLRPERSPGKRSSSLFIRMTWSAGKLDRWCKRGSTGVSISVCCCSLWRRKNGTKNPKHHSKQEKNHSTPYN